MYRIIKIIFHYCILLTPAAVLAQGAGGGGPPASVRVAEARVAELAPTIEVPGTVSSRLDARLAAEVSGRLVGMADIGEMIGEGETVAQIDDVNYRLEKADYESQVARAKKRIAFLTREVERLSRLASQNIAAKSQLDATESDLQVAREDLKIAEARLGLTEVQLSVTRITAPFPGIISERHKVLGERVSIGDDVVRLVNQESLEVIARAPLSSVAFVNIGDELRLVNERTDLSGSVRTLVPVGDPRSHMFEMRLDISAERWQIGEAVRVVVPTQPRQSLLAVPRDALVLRRDGTSVYRVGENNTAERISVQTGVSSDGLVAITGDIQAGDQVIVRGAERLRPGQTVVIIGGANSGGQPGSPDNKS